jgi:hypothetical protein
MVTETGLSTAQGKEITGGDEKEGELEKARRVVEYNVEAAYLGVTLNFWHAIRDRERGYGIFEWNLEPLPAALAYKTLIAKLADYSAVRKIGEGQYAFLLADGWVVYALWRADGTNLPSEIAGRVRVTSMTGETYEADSGGVALSQDPVYVEPTR